MTNRPPISCFIIAKNEADRIARTIESVKAIAQEIIVIDSGSTDDTVSVAERAGARVLYHAWNGYGMQKRFGEEQCANHWLLNLDADEVMTAPLAHEIAGIFKNGPPLLSGYILKVRDLLPGEKKLSPFAHTNHCLRLYDKRKARFSDSPVHDSVIVEQGETKALEHVVLHHSFRSYRHMLEKIENYSSAQAQELRNRGMLLPWVRLPFEWLLAFLKMYVLRLYALRGLRGAICSAIYAYGRYLRVMKYIALTRGAK